MERAIYLGRPLKRGKGERRFVRESFLIKEGVITPKELERGEKVLRVERPLGKGKGEMMFWRRGLGAVWIDVGKKEEIKNILNTIVGDKGINNFKGFEEAGYKELFSVDSEQERWEHPLGTLVIKKIRSASVPLTKDMYAVIMDAEPYVEVFAKNKEDIKKLEEELLLSGRVSWEGEALKQLVRNLWFRVGDVVKTGEGGQGHRLHIARWDNGYHVSYEAIVKDEVGKNREREIMRRVLEVAKELKLPKDEKLGVAAETIAYMKGNRIVRTFHYWVSDPKKVKAFLHKFIEIMSAKGARS